MRAPLSAVQGPLLTELPLSASPTPGSLPPLLPPAQPRTLAASRAAATEPPLPRRGRNLRVCGGLPGVPGGRLAAGDAEHDSAALAPLGHMVERRPGIACFPRMRHHSLVKPTTGQFTRLSIVLTGPPPGLTNKPVWLLTVTSSPSVISFR